MNLPVMMQDGGKICDTGEPSPIVVKEGFMIKKVREGFILLLTNFLIYHDICIL